VPEHITSWTGLAERDRLYREHMEAASMALVEAMRREAASLARHRMMG
jgi:hypothetical protein